METMTADEALAHHEALLTGADALRAQGNLTGALVRYRVADDLLRTLPDGEGDGAVLRAQAAIASTQQRIGEVLVAQGDLAAALATLRAELTLRRHIATAEPDDAPAREHVARVAARVAEVLVLRSAIATFQGGEPTGAPARRRPGEASWNLRAVAGAL